MSEDRPRLYPELSAGSLRYPFSRDRLFLTCGLASVLLFWAAFDDSHSDGFYTFLRIYVCGLSILWSVLFWFLERPAWSLAAVCSAILFNPIFEIHFEDSDWMLIDFAAGAVFGWIALQPYALFRSKPFVPYLPAIAMSGIALLGTVDLRPSRSFGANEPTMNVDELLTTENVVTDDTTAIDAGPPAWQLAPPVENNAAELQEMPETPAQRPRIDYSQDWRNMRPDGTIAPEPDVGAYDRQRQWLDEVLGKSSKSVPTQPEAETPVANDTTAMDANAVADQ